MISLRRATPNDLDDFMRIERQPHCVRFIVDTPRETHQRNFSDSSIIYLSIDNARREIAGYFILVVERGQESVEFRRIVIAQDERGIGQQAIQQMELFCRDALCAKRIWLDVFDDNSVGRHIYQKLGFQEFKSEPYGNNRTLIFMEKQIA